MIKYTPEQISKIQDIYESEKLVWHGACQRTIDRVKHEMGITLSVRNVKYYCIEKISALKDKIQEINEEVGSRPRYEVIDWHYIIHRKDKPPFKFTVEEIDAMFMDFSKHGNNLSGEQMLQKYEMHPEAWHAIKSALRLYKDSHVISPYTAEHTPEDELDEKIEYAIRHHHDTIKAKMVQTHERIEKEELKKYRKIFGNYEYQLEEFRKFIEIYQPLEVDFVPKQIENNDSKLVVISDIHLGKIDTNGVIRRLNTVYQNIVNSPERVIYLSILGDLVETFVPNGMHASQIAYGTEQTFGYGFDAMLKVADIFEKFLLGLYKEWKHVIVNGITGNHGRVTSKKEEDPLRSGELVVYELVKRALRNIEVDVNYTREAIMTFSYEDMNVIMHHWDVLDAAVPEKLIVSHGVLDRYNLIFSGDKHNVRFNEGKNFSNIRCPALAGSGTYDKSLNLYSEPGYLEVKQNEFNTADVTVKRVK